MKIPTDHEKQFEVYELICDILPFVDDLADEKARFTHEMIRSMHNFGRWDMTKYCDPFSWREMWTDQS